MDNWQLIHRYRYLVEAGEARPFLCPECNDELVTVPDTAGDVVLWCGGDDSAFIPGTMFWSDVHAVVSEFFVDA